MTTWILLYVVLNSPLNSLGPFKTKQDCEKILKELKTGFTLKQSMCLELEIGSANAIPLEAPHEHHHHDGEDDEHH